MSLEFLSAEEIIVNERQRKDFKQRDLEDLAASIRKVGLIHAPVVNSQMQLVAGERRLKALAMVGSFRYGEVDCVYPEVPTHCIPESDPATLFEIELEENLRRVNLTPMEEAAAIASLHNFKVEVVPSTTIKEVAHEVAQIEGREPTSHDEVRVAQSVLVEQFKDDPEVQAAGKVSLAKAFKVAKKKMEIDITRALGGMESASPDDFFEVIQGDCVQVLKGFDDKSVDILLFDPPYGVGADSFGEQAMDLGHQYKDDWEHAEQLIGSIINSPCYKDQAHALMFCSFDRWFELVKLYNEANWKVWPRPFIWFKGQQAHAPRPGFGPRYSYECVLFASRGNRGVQQTINDVFSHPAKRDKIHAAEKPAELLAALIDFVALPGDRILDPTVGSGSIFTAARGKEVYVTGIELSEDYAAIARSRARGEGG